MKNNRNYIEQIQNWLFDVRLWIAVLFLIRLENIDLPLFDTHAWRQSITLGVARNYLEWDANFFHPRTIICDSRGGIQAGEFPIFNYLIFLLWKIFGEQIWCARLLCLTTASFGLWHFWQILKRMMDEKAALAATVFFGTSIAFIYGRKAMPDVFAISLVFIGLSYGWRYLEDGKNWQLLLFFLCSSLGMLSKIPASAGMAFLAAPLFFGKEIPKIRKLKVVGATGLAMLSMAVWYFVWVPWAIKTYQHPMFYPVSLGEGVAQIWQYWQNTWERFYPIGFKSVIPIGCFFIGLGAIIEQKKWDLGAVWVAYSLVFIYFILKAGMVFSTHEYYSIPYLPIIAAVAGFGLTFCFKNKYLVLIAILIAAIIGIYQQKNDFFIHWKMKKYLRLEEIADKTIPKNSRILTNAGDGQPWMMYAAHRIGWTDDDRVRDTTWLNGEATVGLHYALFDRQFTPDSIPYPMLYEDADFRVFKIKKDKTDK